MKHGAYSIGLHHDEEGKPLVIVGGAIFGTVREVKSILKTFDAVAGETEHSKNGAVMSFGNVKPAEDRPATMHDVAEAIAAYDKAKRRRAQGGGCRY